MAAVREGLPDGRYGRSADARADRTLKIVGAVLGAGLLALIAWFGYDYIAGQDVSGRLTGFKVVADDAVDVRLEITKDKDATGVCTVRTLDEYHDEVGRKDFTFDQREGDLVKVVTVRTTARATSAELIGCEPGR
ncbi:DUF4307 domain-containing protein [Streptomyces antimycoticus]|uniref:Membrane protein n=2 Tax=Streptomyces violaceusniger group TaxID=2839105 RepID=A0A4D4K9Y3_9ACTN|nr:MULTISPECIES: DUF4307 domain-containing protein [Streptomyces]AEM81022.1 hypothetical protein Strvi_1271 [Streptomyces violaceusniger Tu 4113]BBJ41365.1 membrane protein [Streptomyces antimycoticus]GDY45072.1 membrane protein [Streptomyces antimycoticus]